MLKALIKKQANELFAILFLGASRSQSKKKKKKSSGKGNAIAKAILFGLLFLVLFAGVCVWAFAMGDTLVKMNFEWMYFIIFGLFALMASIAFNAFVSYNMVFKARDNTLLLSMPIPPRLILFSRMAILFMNCLIFISLFWLPAVLIYQIFKASVAALVSGILILLILAMISLALACLVGWLVALIVRNKTTKIILSILGSILVIGIAIFLRGAMNFLMVAIIQNIDALNEFMNENYPWIISFGNAAIGDVPSLLIFLVIGLVFFGLIYFIMSKTFMFVVAAKTGGKHKVYKATDQKSKTIWRSLLNKEFSFLFKTPVYLINAGLGSILIIIAMVACCFAIPMFRDALPVLREISLQPGVGFPFNLINDLIPFGILGVPLCCIAFSVLSTPSISVEGKTLWVLKSMPIKPIDIFRAKLNMHVIYCLIPAIIFILFLGIICNESILSIITMLVGIVAFTFFTAYFGLFLGVMRANLVWINITMPVKQSLAVGLSLLFNFVIAIIFVAGYLFAAQIITISSQTYILGFAIFALIGCFIFDKLLKGVGVRKFIRL